MHNTDERGLTPLERRKAERTRRHALKDEEVREEFREESVTLAIDPDATRTMSGKPIKRHRISKSYRTGDAAQTYLRSMNQAVPFAQFAKLFNDLILLPFAFHSGPPSQKSNASTTPQRHEDERYVYGTEQVTRATAHRLALESDIIHERRAAMELLDCARQRQKAMQEIDTLADKFQMVFHPGTGRYIHNAVRVLELDAAERNRGVLRDAEIAVYRIKADIAGSRGVKRTIADIYNHDPAEVQLNQNEIAAETARPVVPASLNHRHS